MEKRQKRSVTRYIYSATGEKLHVFHLTAVPNITVAMGQTRELAPSEILSVDSTDYLLGGTLTMRNGRIDKYLFDEGYCQALKVPSNPAKDRFVFYYYDRDRHHGQRRAAAPVQRQGVRQDARPEHLRLRRKAVQPRRRQVGQDGPALREVLRCESVCVLSWRPD